MELHFSENLTFEDSEKNINCQICSIHITINNVEERAVEIIDIIKDNSWIEKLDAINRASYQARSERTVKKLVDGILNSIDKNTVTEFGEYIVSISAQEILEIEKKHIKVPLAEFIKEKEIGNPGFDFHTENESNLIAFGEAKYTSKGNPYTVALSQICRFIASKKDIMEIVDLRNFVTEDATKNAIEGKKAYIAAFSINSKDPMRILKKALDSEFCKSLFIYPELYLIGVEIYDS